MVSSAASLISWDDNFGRGFDYVGTTKGFNYNASFYHCLMLQLLIIEVFDFLHIMVSNFGSWFNKQTCFDYFSTLMKTDVSNFISLGTMSLKMAQRWVKPAIVVNRRKCLFGCSVCTLHINQRSYQFYYLKGFWELPKKGQYSQVMIRTPSDPGIPYVHEIRSVAPSDTGRRYVAVVLLAGWLCLGMFSSCWSWSILW